MGSLSTVPPGADLSTLQDKFRFPIYPGFVPKTPSHATDSVVVARNLPKDFLDRTGERTLATGVRTAAERTESYIRTAKLRDAIKIQVDALMEKYNIYIMSLLERIDDLQNALRVSDEKLAAANNKLVDLFGSNTRDDIKDADINEMFDSWKGIQTELDSYITSAAAVVDPQGGNQPSRPSSPTPSQ